MKFFVSLIAIVFVNGCAFGMGSPRPPVARDCEKFRSWELETKPCILKLNDDDTIDRLCPGDIGYPQDLTGVTIERMNCERNYQDTLIRQCKKWRK